MIHFDTERPADAPAREALLDRVMGRARLQAVGAAAWKASTSALLLATNAVLFDGVWMVAINPEDWIIYTISDPSVPVFSGNCIARRIPSAPRAAS